jgi:hypothetical protein
MAGRLTDCVNVLLDLRFAVRQFHRKEQQLRYHMGGI